MEEDKVQVIVLNNLKDLLRKKSVGRFKKEEPKESKPEKAGLAVRLARLGK